MLLIVAIILKMAGDYESLDNVMFMMRSQYSMQTDAMMWETIIVEASKINAVVGNSIVWHINAFITQ